MSIDVGRELVESNNFWLKKRLLFNLLVGISGLLVTLKFIYSIDLFDILGIIAWGIVANAFYSFGYVLESYIIKKSNGKKNLSESRKILFWIGTICYVILTAIYATLYFWWKISPF